MIFHGTITVQNLSFTKKMILVNICASVLVGN